MRIRYLLFCCMLAGAASAQTNDFITWQQCLDRTKAYNPDLVSARAAVRELEYGVASASAGFLPQINASAGVGYGENEINNNWSENKSTSGGLSLSQDLFAGGANIAKRRRAQAQLRIGEEQYRKTLSDVELRTRLAYIDVIYSQNLVELTEKIADRRGNNVRLIQLRFDGGRENAGTLARSKAQQAQAAFEVREAKRSHDYALRNLAAAIGVMETAPGVAGDLNASRPADLEDLTGLMEQTPAYNIAVTQVEASTQGMKVTRSAHFPTISLDASLNARSSDYDIYNGSWNVGVNARMPLFTGNRNRSETAAAKEKIIQSEMDLMDVANTQMATLQQRWNAYADAVENESVQEQLLEAEVLRAEISTAKYKQGLLSYEDWDIIESNLINQGKTHLQRQRTAELEQARWKNSLGWSIWQEMTDKGEYYEKNN